LKGLVPPPTFTPCLLTFIKHNVYGGDGIVLMVSHNQVECAIGSKKGSLPEWSHRGKWMEVMSDPQIQAVMARMDGQAPLKDVLANK